MDIVSMVSYCVLFQLAHRARRLPDKADHSSRGRHRQVTTSVASLGLPRSVVSYSTTSTVIVLILGWRAEISAVSTFDFFIILRCTRQHW